MISKCRVEQGEGEVVWVQRIRRVWCGVAARAVGQGTTGQHANQLGPDSLLVLLLLPVAGGPWPDHDAESLRLRSE